MGGAVKRLAVRAPDGTLGTVPASEAGNLPEGAELLDAEQTRTAKLQEEHGTSALDQVGAASFGALRSLSLGTSDEAAIALARSMGGDKGAERVREGLAGIQEANPGLSLAGEAAGILAPALLSGGGAAAAEGGSLARGARALTSVPRGVAALGGAAERATARLIGSGAESLGVRALQRGAAMGVGAGVESAAYGMGHEISEAALGDHELVAEHVLSSMARDFVYGAALGGAVGGGGELVKEGARRAAGVALGSGGAETIADALRRKSNELYYKAAGPTQKMAQNAEKRFAGGAEGLGGRLREEVPDVLGRSASSRADFLEAAPLIQKKGRNLIGDALEQLDAAATKHGHRPTVGDVFGELRDQVVEPLAASTSGAAGENAVRNWMHRAGNSLGLVDEAGRMLPGAAAKPITFKELHKLRHEVDDLVFTASGQRDTLSATALKQVRDRLEGRIESGAEHLSNLSGETSLATGYKHAKQVYAAGKELEKAASRGVAQTQTNRIFSLTDNIVGAAGATVGGMIGGAAGAAVGGLGAAAVNHAIRQRFNFVASDLLAKASQLGVIARVAEGQEKQLAAGVRGFLRSSGAAATSHTDDVFAPKRGETRAHSYQRVLASVARLQNQPDLQVRHVSDAMGDVAPKTTAALASKLSSGLGWLSSKLPPPHVDPYHLQQHLEEPTPPTDDELDTAEKYLRAWLHPETLLEDMKHGQASPEAVETVKTQYPKIYERLLAGIDRELASPDRPELTWDQQVQLAILFDRPTDEALEPAVMADVQAVLAAHVQAQNAAPGGGGGGGGGRPDRRERSMQTAAQKAEGE